jgi:D-alanyl-D-alanine carboxypeptidase
LVSQVRWTCGTVGGAAALLVAAGLSTQAPLVRAEAPTALAVEVDKVLAAAYRPTDPGAAVIVVKDGQTILRKGYGMASLELGVPVRPEMVFRLGSITKQFTAAAILMLAQQGKLAVDDDLTKFLPDYPAGGRRVTIEHLLTHTSGIKSYTGMPEFWKTQGLDASVSEMIEFFKKEPFEFEPGEQWKYNNSGYFLLGAIIEKVSGQPYGEFVEKNIFAPLRMSHSFYGDNEPIIEGRVPGYGRSGEGALNSTYLSMKKPYAAGSLLSSVDDLARWDASLYTDQLLTPESKRRLFTPYVLKDGKNTHYAYGFGIEEYEGRPLVAHGGGINGFQTYALRLPEDRVFVALLSNREWDPGPDYFARKVGALAIGRPLKEPVAVVLPPSALDAVVGVYRIDANAVRTITREGTRIFAQRTGGDREEVFAESDLRFFYRDSFARLVFERDGGGRVARVVLRAGPFEEAAARTDEKP